ncbi:MAG TPA: hypothetical protein VHW74_16095 [Mycobacteriales bacterium]|nr:hypothetical protein [Mycobacteriales bacterium]
MAVGYLVTVLLAALPTFFAVFAPRTTRGIARTGALATGLDAPVR